MIDNSTSQLDVTIKFIQDVKDNLSKDARTGAVPIFPRVDESIYFQDVEQSEVLYSFTS